MLVVLFNKCMNYYLVESELEQVQSLGFKYNWECVFSVSSFVILILKDDDVFYYFILWNILLFTDNLSLYSCNVFV